MLSASMCDEFCYLFTKKTMPAIEIQLFVYLSFLLKISSFMAFNNN